MLLVVPKLALNVRKLGVNSSSLALFASARLLFELLLTTLVSVAGHNHVCVHSGLLLPHWVGSGRKGSPGRSLTLCQVAANRLHVAGIRHKPLQSGMSA